jgi:L-ascorbate metabolism protein UlaG (beta-lactamase superfamily)
LHHEAGTPPFPKHFDGKRFFNPGVPPPPGLSAVLRWMLTGRRQRSPRFVDDVEPCRPPCAVAAGELRVTLINHSTILLQHGAGNILTDPIWSERATPMPGLGPRRRRRPGVRFEDLPRIDTVLLSHNHYDHLDLPTLRRLAERGHVQFVVPARVARLLHSRNIGPAHELDWGESLSLDGTIIHAVPAIHFSGRGLFDRMETLWCGYVIEGPDSIVYFAGDTAFSGHFAAIRERFGAPRLALLPIGAYEPRWFMSPVHMGPEDAVRAHEILGSKASIAIHHGTFQLGDEALDAPGRRLRECVRDDSFLVLNNGQSWTSTHSR